MIGKWSLVLTISLTQINLGIGLKTYGTEPIPGYFIARKNLGKYRYV